MIDRAPLRVAFTNISRRLWAGGYNYQSNLFAALNRYCPGEIIPVVFAGISEDPPNLRLLREFPASKSLNRRRLTVVGSSLVAALASGSIGRQQPNSRLKDRCCVRSRAFFRLAAAFSSGCMVS